jgi:hypothetical protein
MLPGANLRPQLRFLRHHLSFSKPKPDTDSPLNVIPTARCPSDDSLHRSLEGTAVRISRNSCDLVYRSQTVLDRLQRVCHPVAAPPFDEGDAHMSVKDEGEVMRLETRDGCGRFKAEIERAVSGNPLPQPLQPLVCPQDVRLAQDSALKSSLARPFLLRSFDAGTSVALHKQPEVETSPRCPAHPTPSSFSAVIDTVTAIGA